MTISDLCDEHGFMSFEELKQKFGIRGTYMDHDYLMHILPETWKMTLRYHRPLDVNYVDLNSIHNDFKTLRKGSRIFYDKLLSDNVMPHVCIKWENLFHDTELNWQVIFKICRKNFKDVKLINFQYKFLHFRK